jgi:RimJ/RimL family protein N-acetyltransferase
VEDRLNKIVNPDSLLTSDFWEDVFGQSVKKTGPGWTGFACEMDFRPLPSIPTRAVTSADLTAFETISAACPDAEMDPSDLEDPAVRVRGCEIDDELVAVVTVSNSSGRVANLRVAVLPAFRRKGLASGAISGLAADLFADDYVLGYSTDTRNAQSCALAQRLGFWHHSTDWTFIPDEVWNDQGVGD